VREKRFLPRKLKTYQTSLGFFDLAIAISSMKAALEAWGADSNLFHQGAAKESEDADVIAATMKKLGSFSGVLSDPTDPSATCRTAHRAARKSTRHTPKRASAADADKSMERRTARTY
jgi:hypothetical protein